MSENLSELLKKVAADLADASNQINYRDTDTEHDELSQPLRFIVDALHSVLTAWTPSDDHLISEANRYAQRLAIALFEIDVNLHKSLTQEPRT